ncbi:MAG: hypothetical protein IJN39_01915 [Clostridia bacterium]|nr:hypothetical protein [Clostridia bacterium]
MKNRLQGILIGIVIGVVICSVAFADQITETISVVFDEYRLYIDGKDASSYPDDQKPMNYNGRIYVPLRYISEQMGRAVTWEPETKSIYINKAYGEQFEITPKTEISKEELMLSSAIINERLKMAGYDVRYALSENGTVVFSAEQGVLTKEILSYMLSPGVLTMQDKDGNVILERADLKAAYVCDDELLSGEKQVYVEIELTDSGKEKFSAATERISFYTDNENYIKVMLDKELISMPFVYQKIDAKKVIINGAFTKSSAASLAAVLNSTTLPCEFEVK